MVPQRYDVIHIYIIFMMIMMIMMMMIHIYILQLYTIYISVFYSPIPAPWGVAHPGSPWTGE